MHSFCLKTSYFVMIFDAANKFRFFFHRKLFDKWCGCFWLLDSTYDKELFRNNFEIFEPQFWFKKLKMYFFNVINFSKCNYFSKHLLYNIKFSVGCNKYIKFELHHNFSYFYLCLEKWKRRKKVWKVWYLMLKCIHNIWKKCNFCSLENIVNSVWIVYNVNLWVAEVFVEHVILY